MSARNRNDDALRPYLAELGSHDLLTSDEEVELAESLHAAEEGIRKVMVDYPPFARAVLEIFDEATSRGSRPRGFAKRKDRKMVVRTLRTHLDNAQTHSRNKEQLAQAREGMKSALKRLQPDVRILLDHIDLVFDDDVGRASGVLVKERRAKQADLRQAMSDYYAARARLVECNQRLVVWTARRYLNRGLAFGDLVQEGNVGLLRAAERFDPAHNVGFASYAYKWIEQAIVRAIDRDNTGLHQPANRGADRRRVRMHTKQLTDELGREPTVAELVERTGLSEFRITEAQRQIYAPVSLDAPLDEDGTPVFALVADERAENPFDQVLRTEIATEARRALTSIPPRDAEILRMRFGIGSSREHTLQEISDRFEVSKERVRQIVEKRLRELRLGSDNEALDELADFTDPVTDFIYPEQ